QAEDGIRDRTVTGVQTCALPISIGELVNAPAIFVEDAFVAIRRGKARAAHENEFEKWRELLIGDHELRRPLPHRTSRSARRRRRSEERRVGKARGEERGRGARRK